MQIRFLTIGFLYGLFILSSMFFLVIFSKTRCCPSVICNNPLAWILLNGYRMVLT